MVREAAVLLRVRKELNALGAAKFMKTSGAGEPDLVGCVDGVTIVCEVKTPGNVPRPLQRAQLRAWAFAGALALWTNGQTYYCVHKDGTEDEFNLDELQVHKRKRSSEILE